MKLTTQGNQPKFWMLVREGGFPIHKSYFTEKEAIDEAERLCMVTQEFIYVLTAEVYCTRINVPVKWELTKEGK